MSPQLKLEFEHTDLITPQYTTIPTDATETSSFKGRESELQSIVNEYMLSVFDRGDNSVESAVALGALDARKLYPDYEARSLEDAANEFYRDLPEIDYSSSMNL